MLENDLSKLQTYFSDNIGKSLTVQEISTGTNIDCVSVKRYISSYYSADVVNRIFIHGKSYLYRYMGNGSYTLSPNSKTSILRGNRRSKLRAYLDEHKGKILSSTELSSALKLSEISIGKLISEYPMEELERLGDEITYGHKCKLYRYHGSK